MRKRRLFGTEVEYGLQISGRGAREQMEDAAEFVASHDGVAFCGWDYGLESPRCDMRGFSVDRLAEDPIDAQFDEGSGTRNDRALRADRVLVNGARFYNDHGHPEYSTPECSRIADLVAQELAGERIVCATAARFSAATGREARVFKNNTDYHGASYGAHESFLVGREISYEKLLEGLLPLFVTRQILVGAGKVGSENSNGCEFQLSQRADFLQEKANVETLYRRPIFNTRDEPHADASEWARLHVICGDASRMPWCISMKAGMVLAALRLIELGECPRWELDDVVSSFSHISKDKTREWKIPLKGGSWTTGIDILDSYVSSGERHLMGEDAEMDWVLGEWRIALLDLRANPSSLRNRVDWVAKERLLTMFAEESGSWDEATLQSIEMEYHDLNLETSLFSALDNAGEVMQVVPRDRVLDAMTLAPQETRAAVRGALVKEHSAELETIGWRRAVLKSESDPRVVELEVEADSRKIAEVRAAISEWKAGSV